MKKFTLPFVFISLSLMLTTTVANAESDVTNLAAADDFITTWRVGANQSITIPTYQGVEDPETYNYTVRWGDGNSSTGQTDDATHTYIDAGDYTVSISGTFPRIYFNNEGGDRNKIIAINQWGTGQWTSMRVAFAGASNLVGMATDRPDLSMVTSMRSMFYNATVFNQAIGDWDVSKVESMRTMFAGASAFNQNLDQWDVSKVKNMAYMFEGATQFNGNIGGWKVGEATNMRNMFRGASVFNQAIGDWDVSAVENMFSMFYNATAFNQAIGWEVGEVTNMASMFGGATAFNQDIGDWDVSAVENMFAMFAGATAFNQAIGDWNVSAVENMQHMFSGATAFNQAIGDWNVSAVENMQHMFRGATAFNHPIGDWEVGEVTNMASMFNGAIAFNRPVGRWDVSAVADMSEMFKNITDQSSAFNQAISDWEVGEVTNMASMFAGATVFNHPIGGWDVSAVENMQHMFSGATAFNQALGDWKVGEVTNMASMFNGAIAFDQAIGDWDVSAVADMSEMFKNITDQSAAFDQPIGDWDVGEVTNMASMFSGATAFNQPIGDWDVSAVEGMYGMFSGATVFNHPIGDWDVRLVKDMDFIFTNAPAFSQNLGRWYVQDAVYVKDGIRAGSAFGALSAQNSYLNGQNLVYTITGGADRATFSLSGGVLTIEESPSHALKASYTLEITAMGGFSSPNSRVITVHVDATATAPLDDFVTVWKTTTTNEEITFPGTGNYTIDWGDGSTVLSVDGSVSHTYATAGSHTVRASNTIKAFRLNDSAFAPKLERLTQWGTAQWTTMESAFYGAANLTLTATDAPDLSEVTDMRSMFENATSFNQDIGDWNTENVTNMRGMFSDATAFDQDIGNWNVSAVENASDMFDGIALSTANYDALLVGWNGQTLQSGVTFDGGNSLYSSGAATARANMIASDRWTITDGGQSLTNIFLSSTNIAENAGADAVAGMLSTNATGTYTYTLVAGTGDTDNGNFNISGTQLRLTASADYETKRSYSVRIQVSDGTQNFSKSFIISVTDEENEAPPVITSNGGGETATVSVEENQTVVTTVTATDGDTGQTVTFSLSGADANHFTLDSGTGELVFKIAPDFEMPRGMPISSNNTNDYTVTITASDGHASNPLSAIQTITVTVTDVDDVDDVALSVKDVATTGISIYPNPAGEVVRIGNLQGNAMYSLSNLSGKILLTGTLTADKAGHSVDISALPQGVYLLHLTTDRGNVTGRIVKQKVRD